ncbi:MAG: YicC family protein [Lachnospiraceae bacterium]|nr:YicC family protein [Lachnospiraceae bacterium]
MEGGNEIKSMTGFGRGEVEENSRRFTVEIKSVNHRYLDVTVKMPKKLNYFESSIRGLLKEYIQRGKVDVFITFEDYSVTGQSVCYNEQIAAEYMNYLEQMSKRFGLENDVRLSVLSRYPEVFSLEDVEVDETEIWKSLEKAVRKAAEMFIESRKKEGETLRKDLLEKLDGMLEHVDFIEKRSPELVSEYKEKIYEKVRELLADAQIDDNRILMEVTLFADKICVDEETVRLRSHIENTKQMLIDGGSIGRKLDFMAQEMNREANTTLSKSGSLDISNHAIELKSEIEKIREQIQNLE